MGQDENCRCVGAGSGWTDIQDQGQQQRRHTEMWPRRRPAIRERWVTNNPPTSVTNHPRTSITNNNPAATKGPIASIPCGNQLEPWTLLLAGSDLVACSRWWPIGVAPSRCPRRPEATPELLSPDAGEDDTRCAGPGAGHVQAPSSQRIRVLISIGE